MESQRRRDLAKEGTLKETAMRKAERLKLMDLLEDQAIRQQSLREGAVLDADNPDSPVGNALSVLAAAMTRGIPIPTSGP